MKGKVKHFDVVRYDGNEQDDDVLNAINEYNEVCCGYDTIYEPFLFIIFANL